MAGVTSGPGKGSKLESSHEATPLGAILVVAFGRGKDIVLRDFCCCLDALRVLSGSGMWRRT